MNDRILNGYTIKDFDFVKFESLGVTPFFFKKDNNKSEIVRLTKSNLNLNRERMIYLLTPDEHNKIKKYISITNELVDALTRKIELITEMVPSILVEKIMKN